MCIHYYYYLCIKLSTPITQGTSSCRYDFDDPEFRKYVNLAGDFLQAVGGGLPGDFHPWLHYLPSARYNRAKKLNDGYLAFVRERHEECKENFNASMYYRNVITTHA